MGERCSVRSVQTNGCSPELDELDLETRFTSLPIPDSLRHSSVMGSRSKI